MALRGISGGRERRREDLTGLAQALMRSRRSTDNDLILGQLLEVARTRLGMQVAFLAEFTGGQRIFRNVSPESGTFLNVGEGNPLEESVCQRVVDGRLPELINDFQALSGRDVPPVVAAAGMRAHIGVPLKFSDGTLYGTFCCFSNAAAPELDDRDLKVFRFLADFAAAVVEERERRLKAVRSRRERVETLLAEGNYSVVFQPICDIRDSQPVGFEALARFPGSPPVAPGAWFAEAAAVELQQRMELAVVERALAMADDLPEGAYLSLNVGPETLMAEDGSALLKLLERAGTPPIVIELTEHSRIEAYLDLVRALAPLRQRGVRLAVDDAGAGYASFRHILELKPDYIKLDRSLISNIDSNRDSQALAAALISFAGNTGALVIAEGLETNSELHELRRLGVHLAQGFLLGRPAPLYSNG